MDAADGRLVAGAVGWLFGEVFLDVRFNRLMRDRCRSDWTCGRDVEVDGMLRQTAVKSAAAENCCEFVMLANR